MQHKRVPLQVKQAELFQLVSAHIWHMQKPHRCLLVEFSTYCYHPAGSSHAFKKHWNPKHITLANKVSNSLRVYVCDCASPHGSLRDPEVVFFWPAQGLGGCHNQDFTHMLTSWCLILTALQPYYVLSQDGLGPSFKHPHHRRFISCPH